jgi:beta-phosphoglucomutase
MTDAASPVRAVLFDLDGTLVDNMPYHIAAWIELAATLGTTLTREQVMHEFSGRRNEEILPLVARRTLEPAELNSLAEQKEARYRELYAPHLALTPGAAALLDALDQRGIRYGIASAAPRKNRDFVLDGLGIRKRMAGIVGGEEVAHGKPAPDLFLEGARRVGIAPADILVFEDARLGVQAARAAGMRVAGITTGESAEELEKAGALATSASFESLPNNVRALLGL